MIEGNEGGLIILAGVTFMNIAICFLLISLHLLW